MSLNQRQNYDHNHDYHFQYHEYEVGVVNANNLKTLFKVTPNLCIAFSIFILELLELVVGKSFTWEVEQRERLEGGRNGEGGGL